MERDDWYWMALAQHHGVPTRLMDWSRNPLAATFFAVSNAGKSPAVVYALKLSREIDTSKETDPLEIGGVAKVTSIHGIDRLRSQWGLFTVHEHPSVALQDALAPGDELREIIIDPACCAPLLRELQHYGFDDSRMFPDLPGAATYIRGRYVTIHEGPAIFEPNVGDNSEEDRIRRKRKTIEMLEAQLVPARKEWERVRLLIANTHMPDGPDELVEPDHPASRMRKTFREMRQRAEGRVKGLEADIYEFSMGLPLTGPS